MAIKYQFNKTSLQQLEKQLKVRERALPTIKNKESALRVEVKKAKTVIKQLDGEIETAIQQYENFVEIWSEFDANLLKVKDVKLSIKKIAGVRIPILENVEFEKQKYSLFNNPIWYIDGTELLKELATIGIEREFFQQKMILLDHARKKTTQKVNLFEKVQIPGFEDAIRKIKRFMEDEENLSKAAQKIVKARQEQKEAKL